MIEESDRLSCVFRSKIPILFARNDYKMMNYLKDYFEFTRSERNGALSLIVCISGIFLLPYFYPLFGQSDTSDFSVFKSLIEELESEAIAAADIQETYTNTSNSYYKKSASNYKSSPKKEYTPNNSKYKSSKEKSGKYSKINSSEKSTDNPTPPYQKKEYTKKEYPKKEYSKKEYPKKEYPKKEYDTPYIKKNSTQKIAINKATPETLQQLKGIGPAYSQRIIKFRDALGGFATVDQVGEVFGLPDSTFQSIKPQLLISSQLLKKININTATVDELKLHPYLKWKQANAIVTYREQHGLYNTPNDINKILSLPKDLTDKLIPYLITE